jgi:hypothetical protein
MEVDVLQVFSGGSNVKTPVLETFEFPSALQNDQGQARAEQSHLFQTPHALLTAVENVVTKSRTPQPQPTNQKMLASFTTSARRTRRRKKPSTTLPEDSASTPKDDKVDDGNKRRLEPSFDRVDGIIGATSSTGVGGATSTETVKMAVTPVETELETGKGGEVLATPYKNSPLRSDPINHGLHRTSKDDTHLVDMITRRWPTLEKLLSRVHIELSFSLPSSSVARDHGLFPEALANPATEDMKQPGNGAARFDALIERLEVACSQQEVVRQRKLAETAKHRKSCDGTGTVEQAIGSSAVQEREESPGNEADISFQKQNVLLEGGIIQLRKNQSCRKKTQDSERTKQRSVAQSGNTGPDEAGNTQSDIEIANMKRQLHDLNEDFASSKVNWKNRMTELLREMNQKDAKMKILTTENEHQKLQLSNAEHKEHLAQVERQVQVLKAAVNQLRSDRKAFEEEMQRRVHNQDRIELECKRRVEAFRARARNYQEQESLAQEGNVLESFSSLENSSMLMHTTAAKASFRAAQKRDVMSRNGQSWENVALGPTELKVKPSDRKRSRLSSPRAGSRLGPMVASYDSLASI